MAVTSLGADSAHAIPRPSFEERVAEFTLCGAHALARTVPPQGTPDQALRQAFALSCLFSAAIESGEVRRLNPQILAGSLDAISDLIATAAFMVEESANG